MVIWTDEEYRKFVAKSKHRAPEVEAKYPKPLIPNAPYKNKTEAAYASYLDQLKYLKEIIDWRYEAIGFRLAKGTFHYPDFLVICKDRIEIREVKGFLRDDAAVKFKTCREMFPWFVWRMIKKEKGQWIEVKI